MSRRALRLGALAGVAGERDGALWWVPLAAASSTGVATSTVAVVASRRMHR